MLFLDATLYSGYADAGVLWDYSSAVADKEYEEQEKEEEKERLKDIPDNAIQLYYEGGDILCATTKENYSDAINCLVNGDDTGFYELDLDGKIFNVSSGTYAILIEPQFTTAKVRISDGAFKNEVVYVAIEAIP